MAALLCAVPRRSGASTLELCARLDPLLRAVRAPAPHACATGSSAPRTSRRTPRTGMPKDRYRLYHREKARGGVALTMIGGSAVVSRDSPPAFGNLLLYRDEIVPWLRRLADDVHEAGAAVMCQVTHLGRRTSNYTGDWLPLVYPSRAARAGPPLVPQGGRAVGPRPDRATTTSPRPRAAATAGWTGSRSSTTGTCSTRSCPRPPTTAPTSSGGDLEHRMAFPRRVVRARPGRGRSRLRRRDPDVDGRGPRRGGRLGGRTRRCRRCAATSTTASTSSA